MTAQCRVWDGDDVMWEYPAFMRGTDPKGEITPGGRARERCMMEILFSLGVHNISPKLITIVPGTWPLFRRVS